MLNKPKRVFWINNECMASRLDEALCRGHSITHFSSTEDGILVITDGMVPATNVESEHQPESA